MQGRFVPGRSSPTAPFREVLVDSDPAQCRVYLDDSNDRAGVTPIAVRIGKGRKIRLSKTGYYSTTTLVGPESDERVLVTLRKHKR